MPTDWFGTGGGTATAASPFTKPKDKYLGWPFDDTIDTMVGQAGSIEAEERRRYDEGLGTATQAFKSTRDVLNQPVDTSLLFSKASDAVGARAGDRLNALRTSLGARGLNPNSGAASGMLSRLAFEQNNALVGAEKDIAIDAQKQRQIAAAQNFANALNLAQMTQAPVSGANLETTQNIFEGQLAKYGIDRQAKSAKNANKSNVLGGILGAGASILSGMLA